MRRLLIAVALLLALVACGRPSAELTFPGESNAGSELLVTWTGPGAQGDHITIMKAGDAEGDHLVSAYLTPGTPAALTLPLEDGAYQVAYVSADGKVLASAPLTVTPNTYTLDFPAEVLAGEWFEVQWTGPDNATDYITIVPEGAPEGDWESYAYTGSGCPAVLQASLQPGVYEIRYSTEQVYPNPTLFSGTITVKATDYAVMVPTEVMAGATFSVGWVGPDNPGDYVTIVPAGAPEGSWDNYAYTNAGNPGTLTAPIEIGEYEVRYSTEQTSPNPTLAVTRILVVPMEITLSAPETVVPGSSFEVEWTGPDGNLDYITIVPAGSPEGTYASYAYTAYGSPLSLDAPENPGDYEIWYASDRVDGTFASIPIRVE